MISLALKFTVLTSDSQRLKTNVLFWKRVEYKYNPTAEEFAYLNNE